MKQIPLTQGKFALVDDEDFEWLNQWKWHYDVKGYAARHLSRKTSNHELVYMHRQIMNFPKNKMVDHKDRNGLNNRRENLRSCTKSQNAMNSKKEINNRSGYRGVVVDSYNTIRAFIMVNKRHIPLGKFSSLIDAARARDIAAKKYHGEFASLNFPDKGEQSC